MTAMSVEPQKPKKSLLDQFLELEVSEGYRAELIDGEIIVTPPPGDGHETITWRISSQVNQKSRVEMWYSGNKGLELPYGGRCTKTYVIPDTTYVPAHLDLETIDRPTWTSPEPVAMVVEVTSSNPERDRVSKRHCYALAGIPNYLLVDRTRESLILYSGPQDDDYVHAAWVPFGKPLALPEPFAFELDTTRFY